MDEMRLKLSTRFMRGAVSKLIEMAIRKKLGYKVSIQLNDLDINMIGGDTQINANVELKLNSDEFKKVIKDISSMD